MSNANELMVQAASVGVDGFAGFNDATSISKDSWLNNQNKLENFHQLRVMALGNAKILYGSEKFKFYDVVVAYSEPDAKFAAILMCTFNEATKILRKEVAGCPLAAARAIIQGLLVDTGRLLSKTEAGDQLFGQQGSTQRGGKFELYEFKRVVNDQTQHPDDTSSLNWSTSQAPPGPRAERYSNKRPRYGIDRWGYRDPDFASSHNAGTKLRYDD